MHGEGWRVGWLTGRQLLRSGEEESQRTTQRQSTLRFAEKAGQGRIIVWL